MARPPTVAIVYGSTSGNTADAAERIGAHLETALAARVPRFDVAEVDAEALTSFDVLVVGVSTWNVGELQADWDDRLDEIAALDLRGCRVAGFGTGDPDVYPDTFGDGLGIVLEHLEAAGATLVGAWPAAPYLFDASRALRGDQFLGLLLDYDGGDDRLDAWIDTWCRRLSSEHLAP